jgi:hypothetical protein
VNTDTHQRTWVDSTSRSLESLPQVDGSKSWVRDEEANVGVVLTACSCHMRARTCLIEGEDQSTRGTINWRPPAYREVAGTRETSSKAAGHAPMDQTWTKQRVDRQPAQLATRQAYRLRSRKSRPCHAHRHCAAPECSNQTGEDRTWRGRFDRLTCRNDPTARSSHRGAILSELPKAMYLALIRA